MRLAAWMQRNRCTDKALIEGINPLLAEADRRSWRSVKKWREGACVPRMIVVVAISDFTGGSVTYEDHVETVREAGYSTRRHPPNPLRRDA
jgi:hypothetical protein